MVCPLSTVLLPCFPLSHSNRITVRATYSILTFPIANNEHKNNVNNIFAFTPYRQNVISACN